MDPWLDTDPPGGAADDRRGLRARVRSLSQPDHAARDDQRRALSAEEARAPYAVVAAPSCS